MRIAPYPVGIFTASVAVVLHGVFVLYPYFAAGRLGEAVGWRLAICDLPIAGLWDVLGLSQVDPGWTGDLLLFGVGGSLMYAVIGFLPGLGVDMLWRRLHPAQPGGAAKGSQPIRSETNRTSSAAGSRR